MWSARLAVLMLLCAGPCAAGQSVILPPWPEETWSKRQYYDLRMSVRDGDIALPRLSDLATAPLFKRLIAHENVALLEKEARTSFSKWKAIGSVSSELGIFRGFYSVALKNGFPVGEELAQIFVFQLYLLDHMSRMKAQGLADGSIPRDFRRSSEADIVYVRVFETVLDYLGDGKTFSRTQTLAILIAIERHFSGFISLFDEDDRRAAAERLRAMAGKEDDDAVRAAFHRALAVFRSAN